MPGEGDSNGERELGKLVSFWSLHTLCESLLPGSASVWVLPRCLVWHVPVKPPRTLLACVLSSHDPTLGLQGRGGSDGWARRSQHPDTLSLWTLYQLPIAAVINVAN